MAKARQHKTRQDHGKDDKTGQESLSAFFRNRNPTFLPKFFSFLSSYQFSLRASERVRVKFMVTVTVTVRARVRVRVCVRVRVRIGVGVGDRVWVRV